MKTHISVGLITASWQKFANLFRRIFKLHLTFPPGFNILPDMAHLLRRASHKRIRLPDSDVAFHDTFIRQIIGIGAIDGENRSERSRGH